jgi:2-keto-myo-inositol isomerase
VPGKLPENATKEEIIEESVRVLNELADIAEKYNVGLAFEFLGQTDCSVQTLDFCKEIVEKVNRENVGWSLTRFIFTPEIRALKRLKRSTRKNFSFFTSTTPKICRAKL